MKMIRNQCPGKTTRLGLCNDSPKAIQEIVPVSVILENVTPINSPGYDVMQRTSSIYP
jgi:hypothetical protein